MGVIEGQDVEGLIAAGVLGMGDAGPGAFDPVAFEEVSGCSFGGFLVTSDALGYEFVSGPTDPCIALRVVAEVVVQIIEGGYDGPGPGGLCKLVLDVLGSAELEWGKGIPLEALAGPSVGGVRGELAETRADVRLIVPEGKEVWVVGDVHSGPELGPVVGAIAGRVLLGAGKGIAGFGTGGGAAGRLVVGRGHLGPPHRRLDTGKVVWGARCERVPRNHKGFPSPVRSTGHHRPRSGRAMIGRESRSPRSGRQARCTGDHVPARELSRAPNRRAWPRGLPSRGCYWSQVYWYLEIKSRKKWIKLGWFA